ncbi:PLP-dependent aminotransferase family protein [Dactylosporangium darangshiense]
MSSYDAVAQTALGQPLATDVDFSSLDSLLHHHIDRASVAPEPAAAVARLATHVLTVVADLFRAPAQGWSGAIHGGLLMATIDVLAEARRRHPDTVVYLCRTGHDHVRDAVDRLGLPLQVIRHTTGGGMNVQHLAAMLHRRPGAPGLVVASAGSPASEAHDDVSAIRTITAAAGGAVHVHVDAPLAGWHRALLDRTASRRAGIDFADGADSIVVDGHQFLGTPLHSAVAVLRIVPAPDSPPRANRATPIGGCPTGPVGDGGGAAAVQLWHVINIIGVDGLTVRARRARALARYTLRRLEEARWPAWAHPDAVTVLLRPPSPTLRQRWSLPVDGDWARIVCMPGRTEAHIDQFLYELARDRPQPSRPVPPALRSRVAAVPTAQT